MVSLHEISMRVIAATHRTQEHGPKTVSSVSLSSTRLAVVEIPLPVLASRRKDLPLLERYFIEKFSNEYRKPIVGLVRRAHAGSQLTPAR